MFNKLKVLVRGPLLARSGYSEHTRFLVRALTAFPKEFELFVIATNWGATNWVSEDSDEMRYFNNLVRKTAEYIQHGGKFDLSLQVTIPNEFELLAPINIGVTAGIESTKISPEWMEPLAKMNRVITISQHAKNVMENTEYEAKTPAGELVKVRCRTPIDVVHYPVRDFEEVSIDLNLKHDFNFLTVAQWSPRKNLENTVKWFVEEFRNDEVGLVVKANIAKNCYIDRHHSENKLKKLLEAYPDRKCSVHLLHGNMTEPEMQALYQHPKIKGYLSLAHGEGFGLPLFEAAYNELPIISPAWGGQCDFLFAPQVKKGKSRLKPLFAKVEYTIQPIQKEAVWKGVLESHSMWSYPEESSYKMRLREVFKDYGRFKSQAKKLNEWVRGSFKKEDKYLDMRNAVLRVFEESRVSSENEPEVVML